MIVWSMIACGNTHFSTKVFNQSSLPYNFAAFEDNIFVKLSNDCSPVVLVHSTRYWLSHKSIFRKNSRYSYEYPLLLHSRINSSENRLLSFSQSNVIVHTRERHFLPRDLYSDVIFNYNITEYPYERRSRSFDKFFLANEFASRSARDRSIAFTDDDTCWLCHVALNYGHVIIGICQR